MKKRKIVIDFDASQQNKVFGICSFMRDYRLIWFLNTKMGYQFAKCQNYSQRNDKTQKEELYSCFRYMDELNQIDLVLISNNFENQNLITSYKHVNFFMLVNGAVHQFDSDTFLKDLRNIKNVITAFEISTENNNAMNELLSLVELHIIEITKRDKIAKRSSALKEFLQKINNETNMFAKKNTNTDEN